jgi:hypothetical protein
MKMQTSYRIATGENGQVQAEVNECLGQGWKLYGSLTMAIDAANRVIICAQAMTKEGADIDKTGKPMKA